MRPHHSRRHQPPPTSRAARILSREELRLLLLSLTDGRQRHGYELIRQIKAFSRGAYVPSSGMVYPALADLAAAGLTVPSEGEGGRKLYAATAAGITEAESRAAEIAVLRDRLTALGEADAGEPPAIRRALANLDMVLRDALDPADPARTDAIVELIDAAARQIERLER